LPFVLLSKMCLGAYFWSWPKSPLWLTLPLFLSENLTYLTSFIEEIVCRNTCFECNYNIWITFYIFLWNYESIKVGVQLVFNTIWEWHRFTAVIWENDTKSFIFPKLKRISAQNFEGNTTVLCTFCWHTNQVFLHTISSIMMSDKLFSGKIMAMWAIWTFRSRSKVAPPYILDSR
jgi:hypothetical protein